MNADGSQPKRLTINPTDDFAPSWSPDGLQIAFVSDRDNTTGVNNLYVMNADGSNVRRLTNGPENDYSPAWSPDGAWIALRAHHDGPGDIYLIKPDGTDVVNITNNAAEDWAPAWSPDGAWLAFQTDRDGNWEIYVIHPDGSSPLNLTQNPADDQMPYWAPDSTVSLANPASVNCVDQGGTLAIEQRGELGDVGVCYFEDNRQCEEWALWRGDCPVGGLKVTGYVTEAARFCAITGGEYTVTGSSNTDTEQGTCAFKNGKTCDVWAYYNGTCDPND
jgi:Tol biopolymer transport system component